MSREIIIDGIIVLSLISNAVVWYWIGKGAGIREATRGN